MTGFTDVCEGVGEVMGSPLTETEKTQGEYLKYGIEIGSLVLDISLKSLKNIQGEIFLSAGGTTNNGRGSCYFSSFQHLTQIPGSWNLLTSVSDDRILAHQKLLTLRFFIPHKHSGMHSTWFSLPSIGFVIL